MTFDRSSFAQPDQGSTVIGVLTKQALKLQLVQQVVPAGGAEFAPDAERRQLALRCGGMRGLTK
jgi:hypothetical protein